MRIPSTILASASFITAWTTVIEAQAVERAVLVAVAADIADQPGKLLGTGPLPDSAKKRLPHQILVDTTAMCLRGPDKCVAFGSAEKVALYGLVAQRMDAKLVTESTEPPTSNRSTYRFSEMTVRGDTAEVRVFMSWRDWVSPKNSHVVTALFVVARSPDAAWKVVWKGNPSKRER